MRTYRPAILVLVLLLLLAPVSRATWSIAALNKETRTIAVAGASCSYMVYGIAAVTPGQGVVVVQAASNASARAAASTMMSEGTSLEAILKRISEDADYEPQDQQYALLSFDAYDQPRVFTGEAVEGSKGEHAASGFSVQVNTMLSDEVLAQTVKSFSESQWSTDIDLARAVMAALSAGAGAGGDKRCKGSDSSTAFISLFKADDHAQVPWLTLAVYGIDAGKQSAVALLGRQFDHWLKTGTKSSSTQLFLIPE